MSQQVADLRLPRPLLEPQAWPSGEALLILADGLGWGGAFESRLSSAKSVIVHATSKFWSDPDSVFIRTRAEEFSAPFQFVAVSENELPSLQACAEAVFLNSFAQLPELNRRRLIDRYRIQVEPKFESFSDLTYFAGFLKRTQELPDDVLDLAVLEWARFAAFTSPQNDQRLDQSAAKDGMSDLILNPTLEIPPSLRRSATNLRAVFRIEGELREFTLDWQQAAVVDELRENGRMQTAALAHELDSKNFALHKTSSFEDVLLNMRASGILLAR